MSKNRLTVGDLRQFISGLPDDMELSLTISDPAEETYELNPDLTVLTNKNGTPTLLDFDIGDLDDLEYIDTEDEEEV